MAKGVIQKQTEALQEQKKPQTMKDYVNLMMPEIKKALPSAITPERFTRMVLSAISITPKLAECTPRSFVGAMMQSAQLGLEPNTPLGQAYLLPYRNKGIMECQFQIGYKGLIDLAYRSGEVEIVMAQAVHENDEFECEFGLEPKLKHVPASSDRGDIVKVYAMFKTKSGGFGFEVMSVDDINQHAKKYSQSYGSNYSPWKSNWEEMAKKTVLKKALKYAPLKSEYIKGVTADETIKTEISDDMFTVGDDTDYTEVLQVNAEDSECEEVEKNTESKTEE